MSLRSVTADRAARAALMALAWIVPIGLAAQQRRPPRPRAGETIIIHGQVPTPQVVTVRPRAVPDYSRQVLGPALFDQVRASAMAGGYQLVEERQVTGRALVDTTGVATLAADSAAMAVQRHEMERAQARLDSLRSAGAQAAGAPAPGQTPSSADSAARAAEMQAIMKQLEVHRARLDSLAAVVRSIGVPDSTRDSTRAPRDSTRKPIKPD